MANSFISGKGKDVFVKKLKELSNNISVAEGIIINIPEYEPIEQKELLKVFTSLSPDEDVQITKLNI